MTFTLQQSVLSLNVGDLPSFDFRVESQTPVHVIVNKFGSSPSLPGVMIMNSGCCVGMVSRRRCFEHLGKPFGVDLFLKRPVIDFYKQIATSSFILNENISIEEAVHSALSRPPDQVYEPILVQYNDQSMRLLDIHTLLLAQSQLLANANQYIRKQNEIGRSLSMSLDLNEVLKLILKGISEVVPFDIGLLIIKNPGEFEYSFYSSKPENQENSRLFDTKEIKRIWENYHSKEPTCMTQTLQDIPIFPFVDNPSSTIIFPFQFSGKDIAILFLSRQGLDKKLSDLAKEGKEFLAITGRINQSKYCFNEKDLKIIESLQNTFTSAIRNAQLHHQVERNARTDLLTGILNRRGFFESGYSLFEQYKTGGIKQLIALMIDIDHFKSVNDAYGHTVGDLVIRKVARLCAKNIRETDLFARYGGEEFVSLLKGENIENAFQIAERIRNNVEKLVVTTSQGKIAVTVSIGLAISNQADDNLDTLLQRSDKLLYQAKKNGRNRVEVESDLLLHEVPNYYFSGNLTKTIETCQGVNFFDVPGNDDSESLERVYDDLIQGWVHALELRDMETEGHAQRVAEMTISLAKQMGFSGESLKHIKRGALLHDIGKIAIPDSILLKPGSLSDEEWLIMQRHPLYAYDLLSGIEFLNPALDIPYCHHEWWNGNGYPRKIKGSQIPLAARLFAIIDVWDALNSDRPYRPAWNPKDAEQFIISHSGTQFDPCVVENFLKLLDENRFFYPHPDQLKISNGQMSQTVKQISLPVS